MRRFVVLCSLLLAACGGNDGKVGGTTAGGTTAGGTTAGGTTAGGTTAGGTTAGGTTGTTGTTGTSGTTGTPPVSPAPGRQSWAWVYTNWTASATAITSHASSFTHISPTFYQLNYSYVSGVAQYWNCSSTTPSCNYEGKTPAQYTAEMTQAGLLVVPAIFAGGANSGVDTGVQNILNDAHGEAESFIAAMVTEAVTQGYAGYNLDWELSSTGSDYADKFVTFVNNFKTAMAPHHLTLSVDAIVSNINGTYCSSNNGYLDFGKLSTSSIDAVIIEDYTASLGNASTKCNSVILSSTNPVSCPLNSGGTDVNFTGVLDYMCSNLPASKVVIGLESYSANTNAIAGAAITAVEDYGLTAVAVWPQVETSDFMSAQGLVAPQSDWYGVLSAFLAK